MSSSDLWSTLKSHSNSYFYSLPRRSRSGTFNDPSFTIQHSLSPKPTPHFYDASYDYGEDPAPPRASVDSEEHPFEHWYRGEVSRNDGVRELRVGKRLEML
jgi:hypothetical protein